MGPEGSGQAPVAEVALGEKVEASVLIFAARSTARLSEAPREVESLDPYGEVRGFPSRGGLPLPSLHVHFDVPSPRGDHDEVEPELGKPR